MRFICFSLILISGILFEVVISVDLPLDKCHLEDSTCMVKGFQNAISVFINGIPNMGVEVMDIFKLDDLSFDLSGLAFAMKNGRLKGFRDIIIDNVKWDTKTQRADIYYHIDYCEIWGSYTASGRMLILPIQGDGEMFLQFKNLHVKVTLYYDVSKNNNKTFIHVKQYSCDHDVRGYLHQNLTNLFNGNKELSDTLLNLMNENWKQVVVEFGKPLMDSVSKRTIKNVNRFLSHAPLEEITLP